MKRTVAATALIAALVLSGCASGSGTEPASQSGSQSGVAQSGPQSGSSASDRQAVATAYGTLLTGIIGMDRDKVSKVVNAQETELKGKSSSDVSNDDLTKYGDQLLETLPVLSLINVDGKSAMERYVSYASVVLSGETLSNAVSSKDSTDVDVPVGAVSVDGSKATVDLTKVKVAGSYGSGTVTLVKKNGAWLLDSGVDTSAMSGAQSGN